MGWICVTVCKDINEVMMITNDARLSFSSSCHLVVLHVLVGCKISSTLIHLIAAFKLMYKCTSEKESEA